VFSPHLTVPPTMSFAGSKLLPLISHITKSIMAANTTIQIPDGVVVYTAAPNGTDPKSLDRSNPSVYKEGLMTLPHQWVLYIGVKYSDNPPNSNFGGLAAGLPVYTQTDNGPLSTWEYQSLAPSVASLITYFVPHDTSAVDPAATLQYASISAEVAGRAGLPTAPLPTQTSGSASISASNTALSSTSASSTSPSSTSPSSAFLNGTSSIVTSTNTDPADIASAASISAVASLKHTTIGAAIGGSIGGLVIGIAAALIALACLRRRALQGSGKHSYRSGAGDATTDRRLVSLSKEMQFVEAPTAVTGWQKHLPQEKDDRAICEAVKTVFDQIQVHTEGFYNSKPGKLISSAADLGRISPDGFSKKLSKASNSLPILEGILIRWIVQRISLRADVEDSFLPFEYTNIPKQNGWHMESDEQSSNHVVESRKGQRCLTRSASIPADKSRLSPSVLEMAHAHWFPVP
jgi:hypothetical protein